MPALVCPRCQRANPDVAVYCYFDGADLRGRSDGPAAQRLAQSFVFPSGRSCHTFDDFAQACRDEWIAARDLLRQGVFKQFFGSTGRADLAKAARDAMERENPDIALTTFLDALPSQQTHAPKIDINPRRFLLGNLLAGEHRTLQLIVSNQGQGILQGTLSVVEGSDWLKIEGATPAPPQATGGVGGDHLAIVTPREQKVVLKVDTRGLPAGQTYGAKLTVITNGGVVEVLARMDLVAQPYPKTPFQGVKTPREMAERMRAQPKAAGPILESGEVARWFSSNGWSFPIRGQMAKGVAGVQQFFETMGLSKPPTVKLSQTELRIACAYPEPVRFQVQLQTQSRKWVYGHVTSEAPWLKVLTPQVAGPQQASINLEVDPTQMSSGPSAEGKAQVVANAGQILSLRVLADVKGLPSGARRGRKATARGSAGSAANWLQPVFAMAIAFLLLRLALVLFVDTGMRSAAVSATAAKLIETGDLKFKPDHPLTRLKKVEAELVEANKLKGDAFRDKVTEIQGQLAKITDVKTDKLQAMLKGFKGERVPVEVRDELEDMIAVQSEQALASLHEVGAWEKLPWVRILTGSASTIDATLFNKDAVGEVKLAEVQDAFLRYFLRSFIFFTWWVGILIGVMTVLRRGGSSGDLPWGIVAGAVGGLAGSATLGCAFLVGEIVPFTFAGALGLAGGTGSWIVWVAIALISWTIMGAVIGLVFSLIAPLQRGFVQPVQSLVANLFRLCGLRGLAQMCAA